MSGEKETKAAREAEAAAIRRRWITLGEAVAVIAVVISALTLWNSWQERSSTDAERAAESRKSETKAATLLLVADPSRDGSTLSLKPASESQSLQSQVVRFPAALGVDPVETTGEARIEAGWFDAALKKARGRAGLPDDSRGDERLPVAIETTFLVDGDTHRDIALYDIGYTIEGRILRGHALTLRGLSLVRRTTAAKAQGQVDARWTSLVPAAGK